MKKWIERKLRKILFWVFKYKIKAYATSKIVSDIELVQSKGDIVEYVKREMAHQIGMKLLEDGAIEIEEGPRVDLQRRR